MNVNGSNIKLAMLFRLVLLFVMKSSLAVVLVHGFRRVSLGGTGGGAVRVAVSVGTPMRQNVQIRPWLVNGVAAAQSHTHCSFTVNPNDFVVSSQMPLVNELVILRGGANGVTAIGALNQVQLPLVKFVYLSMAFFAANKMMEGLWFYVFPRISAILRRQPITLKVHKFVWTDLWWPVVNKHYSYTQNIFFALVTSFWLQVWIPYWKDEALRVLCNIWEGWQLFRNGSASWIHVGLYCFVVLLHGIWLYLIQGTVWNCFTYGKRALVEITHDGTDRAKKAKIGAVLVVTTCALYYPLWRWYIS